MECEVIDRFEENWKIQESTSWQNVVDLKPSKALCFLKKYFWKNNVIPVWTSIYFTVTLHYNTSQYFRFYKKIKIKIKKNREKNLNVGWIISCI